LGFSHPVEFKQPEGIELEVVDNKNITVKGIDKQLVGQTAAKIRALRKPEPYKGKGIRYADEVIKIKPGKAGKVI
jgi:large subunit ribosomal protein L6